MQRPLFLKSLANLSVTLKPVSQIDINCKNWIFTLGFSSHSKSYVIVHVRSTKIGHKETHKIMLKNESRRRIFRSGLLITSSLKGPPTEKRKLLQTANPIYPDLYKVTIRG